MKDALKGKNIICISYRSRPDGLIGMGGPAGVLAMTEKLIGGSVDGIHIEYKFKPGAGVKINRLLKKGIALALFPSPLASRRTMDFYPQYAE